MLYSKTSRLKAEKTIEKRLGRAQAENPDPFAAVEAAASPEAREGALLFVGGSSHFDLQVRRAQAHVRFDRRPSYWSHVAIVVDWNGSAAKAKVAEVALMPPEGDGQSPERNGVAIVSLGRYLDRVRYPNAAVVLLAPPDPARATGKEGRLHIGQALRHAIETPNQARFRFRLWDWLAPWAAHVHTPELAPNPLLTGTPLPSAAFCEYAYGSAGVDLVPGATAVGTCPETLWSTVLHWHDRLRPALGRVELYEDVRDPGATSTLGEPYQLKWSAGGKGKARRKS